MKRLCFVCMCLLLIGAVSPAIADLDGIQILSEQYHVWGQYDVWSDWDSAWHSDSYILDSTDSSGISGRISFEDPYTYARANSSAGRFFAEAGGGDIGSDHAYSSYATASVSFQPVTSGWLHAEVSIEIWQGWAILSDSTAGVTLLRTSDSFYDYSGDWLVYDTHEYSLYLSAWSTQGDGGWTEANLSFTPIPEPATLLLLGLGAVMLRPARVLLRKTQKAAGSARPPR